MYFTSKGITSLDQEFNPYLIFLISAIAELIGYSCCNFNDKIGRKRGFMLFLFLSSALCLLVALISSIQTPLLLSATLPSNETSMTSMQILKIVFALIGKAMVSAAFNSCYVYNSMLYPSKVRSSALLFTSNLGAVGSYISPQINLLKSVWEPLPYFVFGSSSFLSAVFVFIMPDPEIVKLN